MTTIESFMASQHESGPSPGLEPALQALWWAGKGRWDQAHDIVQGHEGEARADLVHAHLHRQEGDIGNARYWYRRAGRSLPSVPLRDEWETLVRELLAEG
jgi:hypothetical protein